MTKPGDNDGRHWKASAKDNGGANRDADQRTVTTKLPIASWRNILIYSPAEAYTSSRRDELFADIMNSYIDKHINDAITYGTSPALMGLSTSFYEDPRSPLKREAITCGEIIGYRCWRVDNDLLHSVYQPDQWQPGQIIEGRGLQDWDSRGVHAWKGYSDHFYRYIFEYFYTGIPLVTGTVALWGDVVEHERGYRAEFAKVKSLDWLYPNQSAMGREAEVLANLRQRYGV